MPKRFLKEIVLAIAALAMLCPATPSAMAAERLKLLIIDGQNNHQWRKTTPVMKKILEDSGRFSVDVATTPTDRNAPPSEWDAFRPDFAKYDVVLSNYNGQMWPEPVRQAFEKYASDGGAVVIVHAANNAFGGWPEYNRMIGLGWRGAGYGDRLTFSDDGSLVRTPKGEGPGAGHGSQHDFPIVVREPQHPVMKNIPREWMHAKDELYHGQRGPAADMHVLATAFASPKVGGTGSHEPMVWWVPYGKGKVFTTVMGHSDYAMTCVGFQTILTRGCEWTATAKVTLDVPSNFPSPAEVSRVDVLKP